MLDYSARLIKWSLAAPASAAAPQLVAPLAGVTSLAVVSEKDGYQISAVWAYSRSSSWELSDELLKKLPDAH